MSSVIKLVLNDDEMEEARNVGLARQALNRRLGVGETHGFGGDDGEVSVQGCVRTSENISISITGNL